MARLVSMVEDGSPQLREVMAALTPHAGHAQVVGITGSPGVGKSTTTNALVERAPQGRQAGRRARGRPVLAVLRRRAARRPGPDAGPRDRPGRLHPVDGLARATSAGCPGRRHRRCGCSTPRAATWSSSRPSAWARARSRSPGWPTRRVVLMAPGLGDGIQAAKAGILEIGDVYVVNKADRDGAEQVRRELRSTHRDGRAARGLPGSPRSCSPWRSPAAASTSVVQRARPAPRLAGGERRARPASYPPGPRGDRGHRGRRAARPLGERIGHGHDDLDALAEAVVAGVKDPYAAADELVASSAD